MKRTTSLTRRQFLNRVTLIVGAAPALYCVPTPGVARAATGESLRSASFPGRPVPIVSFHIDQLYVDKSGTAPPYMPPSGTRSGHTLSELSDEAILCRCGYF